MIWMKKFTFNIFHNSLFHFPFSIHASNFSSMIGMKKDHPSTNFGCLYLLHTMLDWGDFYTIGFVSTKITHMQVGKIFGDKNWRNPKLICYFLELIDINFQKFTSFMYKGKIEHCFCHCAYRQEHQMCRRLQPIWWGAYLKVCSKVWHMVQRMGVQHISKITFVPINTTIPTQMWLNVVQSTNSKHL